MRCGQEADPARLLAASGGGRISRRDRRPHKKAGPAAAGRKQNLSVVIGNEETSGHVGCALNGGRIRIARIGPHRQSWPKSEY